MTDVDGHWAAGLADGEGCFAFYVKQRGGCTNASWVFSLSLRDDDIATLEQLRSILCITTPLRHHKAYRTSKPAWVLATGNREEVGNVIEFFQKYPLRSKKLRDFCVWSESFKWYETLVAATPYARLRDKRNPVRSRLHVLTEPILSVLRGYETQLQGVRQYGTTT